MGDKGIGRLSSSSGSSSAIGVSADSVKTSRSTLVSLGVSSAPGSVSTGSAAAISVGTSTRPIVTSSWKWVVCAPAFSAIASTSPSERRPSTSSRTVR